MADRVGGSVSGKDLSWIIEAWPPGAVFLGVLLLFWMLGWTIFRCSTALHRLRLLAEQALAGQRSESETTRASLAVAERALTMRIEQSRVEAQAAMGQLATVLARDQGDARAMMELKLREMAEASAARLATIEATVGAHLHAAVEQQMTTSFQRVLDQFAAVQKAMVDVQTVSAGIGDIKRIFANVKTRGGWGETQLRALLDDLLPPGGYTANAVIAEGRVVEFAIRMPGSGAGRHDERPLLPIDAKFPLADYERLLDAAQAGDGDGERASRRALEATLRVEARRIATKYIAPPVTTEFAVLYLPTDGLYAEAASMAGLLDDLGRTHRVLVMGPGLLPGLLRTIHLGYVTLALEQKAEQIGRLLGATRQEMLRMDEVLDRLGRNATTMARTIEDARTRTRVVQKKLRDVEIADDAETDALLS
jgi:DNA recombination protein RmuC